MKKIIIVAVCLIIAALSIYKISGYLLEMLESQNLNDSLTKEAVMKLPPFKSGKVIQNIHELVVEKS